MILLLAKAPGNEAPVARYVSHLQRCKGKQGVGRRSCPNQLNTDLETNIFRTPLMVKSRIRARVI